MALRDGTIYRSMRQYFKSACMTADSNGIKPVIGYKVGAAYPFSGWRYCASKDGAFLVSPRSGYVDKSYALQTRSGRPFMVPSLGMEGGAVPTIEQMQEVLANKSRFRGLLTNSGDDDRLLIWVRDPSQGNALRVMDSISMEVSKYNGSRATMLYVTALPLTPGSVATPRSPSSIGQAGPTPPPLSS